MEIIDALARYRGRWKAAAGEKSRCYSGSNDFTLFLFFCDMRVWIKKRDEEGEKKGAWISNNVKWSLCWIGEKSRKMEVWRDFFSFSLLQSIFFGGPFPKEKVDTKKIPNWQSAMFFPYITSKPRKEKKKGGQKGPFEMQLNSFSRYPDLIDCL